ncbi:MAG TPA: hypothetical protein VLC12_01755, partial [Terriglobales bacterium]|nr:hypothetical protein [Terriglobales bacterium]
MRVRLLLTAVLLALTLPGYAQTSASPKTKTAKTSSAGNTEAPSKALMDAIWAGWSSGNPANVAKYYAKGAHVFFDITPLK